MKYIVKIEQVLDKKEDDRYASTEAIYEQAIESDEPSFVTDIIKAANGLMTE